MPRPYCTPIEEADPLSDVTNPTVMSARAAGAGFPVLLLHQTPRSWDEYRDVLKLLGRHVRAIAMDTLGFGDSDRLHGAEPSIEIWAAAALAVLDALGISTACVVGHHTGAVIAVEMSSCPMVDAARRVGHAGKRVIDDVERRADGSHLTELWSRRRPYYPADDTALLERFVADALKAGPMAAEGHHVVNRYHMEQRLHLITCPTLVIAAPADPHAYPSAPRVAQAISDARLVEISGGMVPLPDQKPTEFSDAIINFLREGRLLF
jgi:pimeloyl-ACP methyl ester carboxylesterase